MVYQDWTPAGWDKRGKKPNVSHEKQVNTARRLDTPIETTAKCMWFEILYHG